VLQPGDAAALGFGVRLSKQLGFPLASDGCSKLALPHPCFTLGHASV
jgi:hypothetical protein